MATYPFSGGAAPVDGYGERWIYIFGGTWAFGDTWLFDVQATSGTFDVGQALQTDDVTPVLVKAAVPPSFAVTLANRIYLALGAQFNFCDNNDPTEWYQQGAGAGYVDVLSQYGSQDQIYGFASYQGMLAAFLGNSIQIWSIEADPTNFFLKQALNNIGTKYPFSVQAVGDWDVFFLADSGVRSLRVRDSSLNAITTDVGSPIDSILQAVLQAGNAGTPVSIVESTVNRYWMYMNGVIYVLSFFRTEEIMAWSTYLPTVDGTIGAANKSSGNYPIVDTITYVTIPGQRYTWTPGVNSLAMGGGPYSKNTFSASDGPVTFIADSTLVQEDGNVGTPVLSTMTGPIVFVPTKFVVYQGQVYVRGTATINGVAGDYLIAYGGGYDSSVATVTSPYLPLRQPKTDKVAENIDVAITGKWQLAVSLDQASGLFETVGSLTAPTYDGGKVAIGADGSHFAFKLVSTDNNAAKVSEVGLEFEERK